MCLKKLLISGPLPTVNFRGHLCWGRGAGSKRSYQPGWIKIHNLLSHVSCEKEKTRPLWHSGALLCLNLEEGAERTALTEERVSFQETARMSLDPAPCKQRHPPGDLDRCEWRNKDEVMRVFPPNPFLFNHRAEVFLSMEIGKDKIPPPPYPSWPRSILRRNSEWL